MIDYRLDSLYFWLGAEAEHYVVLLTGNVIPRAAADLALVMVPPAHRPKTAAL